MQEIYQELAGAIERNIPAILCLVVRTEGSTPRKAGASMIVYGAGHTAGTIGGGSLELRVTRDALDLLSGGSPLFKTYILEDELDMTCGGTMDVYLELTGCQPRLYIFGAGHIGKALAGYTPGLGFRTHVFDQRNDAFGTWNVPEVVTHTGDFLQIIDTLEFDKNTYIVIVTPGHQFDEMVLLACAPRECAYLGMIGSIRKVAEIIARVREGNLLPDGLIERVDMPIGIPFAAETPAEIAISIAAKLIDVKNRLKKS